MIALEFPDLAFGSTHRTLSLGPVPREAPEPELAVRPCRIMVVDDNENLLEVLELCLTADGHCVRGQTNAVSALASFRAERWDLVLVDRVMPELSGPELALLVRKIEPQIPLVLISGLAAKSPGEEEIFDSFVRKPFTRATLRAGIAHALQSRGRG